MRLELLLDFANALPELPPHLAGDRRGLEQVVECQTPFFVAAEPGPDGRVALHFDAPREAPTTRGYAGVLSAGLSGATAEEILSTPSDFFTGMGLAELISPLRLRGMGAILVRVKRQVHERVDGDAS
jgi:cysteine desulfuration protein SufE